MKKKILSVVKIYGVCFTYILLISFIYAFYLMKSHHDSNFIVELILGITSFLILGLLYGNAFHKRGLIVGIVVGILHLFLLYFIIFLAVGKFELKLFPIFIYPISSALGGVLGLSFKKVI